jgi:hypothetical protein
VVADRFINAVYEIRVAPIVKKEAKIWGCAQTAVSRPCAGPKKLAEKY